MKRSRGPTGIPDALAPSTKRATYWSKGLISSMKDPNMIVISDEKTVMIKDMYPKAKHHYLVLPREDIASLKSVDTSHIPLLKKMLKVGRDFVHQLVEPNLQFQYGFHAAASMERLHMHVISRDFDSVHLKTKRHWNTFTSEFFVDAQTIISTLEDTGKLELFDKTKCELLLKKSLQCHVCGEELVNMPKLKLHIKVHNRK